MQFPGRWAAANEAGGPPSFPDAGAAACYILRLGSQHNRTKLARLVGKDDAVRRRIVEGLWDEYDPGHRLIATIFELSDPDERYEILVTIDIRDSEKFDVSSLVRLIRRQQLKPWEDTLLHLTIGHRNWA